jgi:DNA-binding transcriptional ArsR family regulator
MSDSAIDPAATEVAPTRELDLESLKALSHAMRVQIINALSVYGPATASGLGERLGESSGATSYHLRQLEKHGFIREVDGKGTGRERWWERVPGAINIGSSAAVETPAGHSAAQLIFREFLQNGDALLLDFAERGHQVVSPEWMDTSVITTANARLTLEQMQVFVSAVNKAIDDHVVPYRGQQGEDTRAVQIHFNAFPVLDAEAAITPSKPSGEGA